MNRFKALCASLIGAILIVATLFGASIVFGVVPLLLLANPAKAAPQASPSLVPLFRLSGETVGTALSPASPPTRPAEGEDVKGRATPLDPTSFEAVATVKPGDRVLLPLTRSDDVTAIVRFAAQEGATVRIGGVLVDKESRDTFFITTGENHVSGLILVHEKGLAYRIDQAEGEEVILRELLISDVMCPQLPRMENDTPAASVTAPQTVPFLNSRSTATAQIYLDFDGETVSDPDWNGGATIQAQSYNLSAATITAIFNRVKEDFWPFNVNVTTDVQKYNAAPVGKRMRCIITPTDTAAPGAGGVAYVNSFSQAGSAFSSTVPCWVFNSGVVSISEAISHEVGHTLGLHHDGREIPGTGHEEYYYGQGSGDTGWCPIMGAGYYEPVTQWSKGEYQYANNQQNDTAIISSTTNGFGYVVDEAGATIGTSAVLGMSGGAVNQAGIISLPTDADVYGFSTTGGGVNIDVTPAAVSPNLDAAIEIYNASGGVVAASNPSDALGASILVSLPAGNFYLKVLGSGANDPFTTGYSNYGSIGAYVITGNVPGGGGVGKQQNLTPYQPGGWSDKIVVSRVTGTTTDATTVRVGDVLYLDWAVINNGSADITSAFTTELYVDGILKTSWSASPPTGAGNYRDLRDYNLGSLSAGTHTLRIRTDSTNSVSESNESDNEYTKTITVLNSEPANLTPFQPSGWSNKIVLTKIVGTSTDSSTLTSADTLYLDWAVINNGNADITTSFVIQLFVDNVLRTSWTASAPTNVNYYRYVQDYNLGTLSVGTHTVRIKADSSNSVSESNESDNEYTRTFTVSPPAKPNLIPFQPSGWSDKIVVSNISGTATDSTSLRPTEQLYIDWAVLNNGEADISVNFTTELYVDGVLKTSWTSSPPTNVNYYRYVRDFSIGTLAAGTHTIRIKADSTNVVAETSEADNEFTKTFTVLPPPAPIANGAVVGLVANANGMYVTAESAGKNPLIANRSSVGPWEQFQVLDVGGGYVALRSLINGRFVCADNAGASPLIANRDSAGIWEQFYPITTGSGSFALIARANGKFVCADNGGSASLIANRTSAAGWEQFRMVFLPSVKPVNVTASFQSGASGAYVCADNSGGAPLVANRPTQGAWEQFQLVDLGNGNIAIRSLINGQFVTADNYGAAPLIANRSSASTWEQFQLLDVGSGQFALRAVVNGQYVSAGNTGNQLIANRSYVGPTEQFVLNVSLRAMANNSFVTAPNNGASPLIANQPSIGVPEQFQVVNTSNGFFALKAKANGLYVCADNSGNNPLIANRSTIGLWEQFQWIVGGNGNVALRAAVNGMFVCADNNGNNPLIANRSAASTWEQFR